jgi:hypothetical protein
MCLYDICRANLGFIVSKEGKIPNLKKVQAIVNMPVPTNPHRFEFSMVWFNFINVL